jgi:hypothetical protein
VDRPARWKFLMPNCSLLRFIGICRRGFTWHIREAMGMLRDA